jgi:S1-C subfamily serine protease
MVTNGHVVGDAKVVDLTFVDGSRYSANVIAKDINNDIAVLQISKPQQLLSSLKPLVLGNSSKMDVGDAVIAIGNPFGLSDTMTTGIVSGIGRSLPISLGGFMIPNVIQTDAPVNPNQSNYTISPTFIGYSPYPNATSDNTYTTPITLTKDQ